ncbi:PREDICTED: uncharacterized protein LOC108565105 [Nicrophorus vespilloides]|uniref:Uncharacterized protein LOC108565105 n=1 Tax=Nicrophorus vespilloides TaxID=110193 RepID=A0ABM1MZ90_NICVS|nr:PREDICTED: uncharacterized protein LOC108565105 [Nicrophorus vespilloides]
MTSDMIILVNTVMEDAAELRGENAEDDENEEDENEADDNYRIPNEGEGDYPLAVRHESEETLLSDNFEEDVNFVNMDIIRRMPKRRNPFTHPSHSFQNGLNTPANTVD